MGWKCTKCGATSPSDNLNFPMTHGFKCDGEVVPDSGTTKKWGRALGFDDIK